MTSAEKQGTVGLPRLLVTQGMHPFSQRVGRLLTAEYQLLFGDSGDLPDVLVRTGNYVKLPSPGSVSFVHEMLKSCLDRQVELVVPLGAEELLSMADARQLFEEYGISVCVPDRSELPDLPVVQTPPRALPLLVLLDGRPIHRVRTEIQVTGLSGVFTPADSGDFWALCCIGESLTN